MTKVLQMTRKAIQEYYEDLYSHCYGCGRLNEFGLQIKSYWESDEAVCHFMPKTYHTAFPGIVYGGLIASLIDCHSVGTAAAAAYRAENREMDSKPAHRYVTASLHVDYLNPTPMGKPITLRASVKEMKGRKAVVACLLLVDDEVCARGEVIVVQVPDSWLDDSGLIWN